MRAKLEAKLEELKTEREKVLGTVNALAGAIVTLEVLLNEDDVVPAPTKGRKPLKNGHDKPATKG